MLSRLLTNLGLSAANRVAASQAGRKVGARVLRRIADKLEEDEAAAQFQESVNRRLAEIERRQSLTLYLAALALAVAVGHVVYAAIRDHVFDGSIF